MSWLPSSVPHTAAVRDQPPRFSDLQVWSHSKPADRSQALVLTLYYLLQLMACSFIPHSTPGGGAQEAIIPEFQMGLREVKLTKRGHTAHKWQSQDLKLCSLTPVISLSSSWH